jgi:hypothetical protein
VTLIAIVLVVAEILGAVAVLAAVILAVDLDAKSSF